MESDLSWATPADALAAVSSLVERAIVRRTWLFPIDDLDGSAACIQIQDMPVDPDPEDIGRLAEMVTELVQRTGSDTVVVVWERPGGPVLRMQEADWAAGLAASDAPVRAQMLAHDDGCRLLDPAFEALVA